MKKQKKPFVSKKMVSISENQNHVAGIVMAEDSFDRLLYNECGNEVTGIVRLK